jgi:ubiquinone/menaquinone biosynthesis C-methylase UbiE
MNLMKMGSFEARIVSSPAHSRRVAAHAVRRVARLAAHGARTYLDVGCGNGAAALQVANTFGLHAVGIDIDPDQIQRARHASSGRRDVSFITADAAHLPFADARFDIVATNKTTHHLAQWKAALLEMRRVLRPGGYLIYSDVNAPRWLAGLLRWTAGEDAGIFTRDDLDRWFTVLGVRRVYRTAHVLHYDAAFVK